MSLCAHIYLRKVVLVQRPPFFHIQKNTFLFSFLFFFFFFGGGGGGGVVRELSGVILWHLCFIPLGRHHGLSTPPTLDSDAFSLETSHLKLNYETSCMNLITLTKSRPHEIRLNLGEQFDSLCLLTLCFINSKFQHVIPLDFYQ